MKPCGTGWSCAGTPRAKAFYERLGFVEAGRPREHKIALRYTAP